MPKIATPATALLFVTELKTFLFPFSGKLDKFPTYKFLDDNLSLSVPLRPNVYYAGVKQLWPWSVLGCGDRSGMSISADSPSDETLN